MTTGQNEPSIPTGRSDRRERCQAIPATYQLHRGPVGVTNLMVRKRGGTIVLDPGLTGGCVISLEENEARQLCDLLTEWLR